MKIGITYEQALEASSPMLRVKLAHSIALMKRGAHLATAYDADGYWLGFSGGKDSQCLFHIAQLAEVPFKAHYSPTTVDPPEVIRFIRHNYPEVDFTKPEMSIYQMAEQKGLLPTRIIRWCCAEFKEKGGAGKVCAVGVRKQESVKRSKYDEVSLQSRKYSGDFDGLDEYRQKITGMQFDEFSEHTEQMVGCIKGKDKVIVSPLLEWTDRDVWEFLNSVVRVPHCCLYDEGQHRIGCIGCPMANARQKAREFERWPHIREKWIKTIEKIIANGDGKESKIGYLNFSCFENPAQAVFDWWVSDKSYDEFVADSNMPKLFQADENE